MTGWYNHCMKAMETKVLEKEIQLAICDYLAYKQVFFWRQNIAPVYDSKKERFRAMPKYSLTGVSDIIALKDGTAYFIEVKRPKGVQSENQKIFEKLVHDNGGVYKVVMSIDDVMAMGL